MSAIDHSRMIDGTCKMTIMTHGPWMTINGPRHVDNWCTFHLYEKVICFERSPPMEFGWQVYVGEGHGSMEAPGDSAVRYRRGGHGGVWKHLWIWLLSIGGKEFLNVKKLLASHGSALGHIKGGREFRRDSFHNLAISH